MPTDVLSPPLLRDIDWRGSTLLNVVLQTSFSLTVSTCRRVASCGTWSLASPVRRIQPDP
jgi:hypothetical protein